MQCVRAADGVGAQGAGEFGWCVGEGGIGVGRGDRPGELAGVVGAQVQEAAVVVEGFGDAPAGPDAVGDRDGHLLAMEAPELLVDGAREFFGTLR